MATAAELLILLKARNEAEAAFRKAKGDLAGLDASSRTTAQGFNVLKTAVVVAGAALIGGLVVGLKSSIDAAMEAQRVQAQTVAVIKSTGGTAGITAKEIEAMALSFSKLVPFEDEAIQSAQNLLLTFTNIHKDVFPATTQAVLDMSVAMNQDLRSTALQVGKALQSPVEGVTALQRVGVRLTDSQKDLIKSLVAMGDTVGAQKIILQELQVEFGGSAEAAGKTFAGQLTILRTEIGNMQEAIGNNLLPHLQNFIQFLRENKDAMRAWAFAIGDITLALIGLKAVLTITALLRGLAFAISAVGVAAGITAPAIMAAGVAAGVATPAAAGLSFALLGPAGLIAALALGVTVFAIFQAQTRDTSKELEHFQTVALATGEVITIMAEKIKKPLEVGGILAPTLAEKIRGGPLFSAGGLPSGGGITDGGDGIKPKTVAELIAEAYQKAAASIDISINIIRAKFDLLIASEGWAKDSAEAAGREIQKLNAIRDIEAQKIEIIRGFYEQMVIATGAQSEESRKLQLELLQEQLTWVALGGEIKSIQEGIAESIRKTNEEIIQSWRDVAEAIREQWRNAAEWWANEQAAIIEQSNEANRQAWNERIEMERERLLQLAEIHQAAAHGIQSDYLQHINDASKGARAELRALKQELAGLTAGGEVFPEDMSRYLSLLSRTGQLGELIGATGLNIPGFQHGGIVPGLIGQPQLAVVHGGEPIGRGAMTINVSINGAGLSLTNPMQLQELIQYIAKEIGREALALGS